MTLQGPTDPDLYRIKVGRYGERWYQDGDSGPYPSISTVKKASGSDWTMVALKRAAHSDDLAAIAALNEPSQRYERLKQINRAGLDVAAGRGTIIHLWLEDGLHGRDFRDITDLDLAAMKLPRAALAEARLYLPALTAFFDRYQPELILTETVAIHTSLNGVGYGGTVDAGIRLEGEAYGVDWKTRGVDSDHDAYPDEGAQIAAGWRAEYMIVADPADPTGVQRITPPAIAGGLVVSIKHDGVRIYPVDIDKAFDHWTALHAWWVARRDERKPIGKAWQPQGAEPDAPVADKLIANLRGRISRLIESGHADTMRLYWPAGVPTLASGEPLTVEQINLLDKAVARAEAEFAMPFDPAPTPAPEPVSRFAIPEPQTTEPDNGGPCDQAAAGALRSRVERLTDTARQALGEITQQAAAAGRSLNLTARPHIRTFELARALVLWAEAGADHDDLAAQVAAHATPEQVAAADTVGGVLSLFTIDQARHLARALDQQVAA